MKKGLVGYMFDYGPENKFLNIIWRIKKKLGLKVHHSGIPIIVSDKVIEDKTTIIIDRTGEKKIKWKK